MRCEPGPVVRCAALLAAAVVLAGCALDKPVWVSAEEGELEFQAGPVRGRVEGKGIVYRSGVLLPQERAATFGGKVSTSEPSTPSTSAGSSSPQAPAAPSTPEPSAPPSGDGASLVTSSPRRALPPAGDSPRRTHSSATCSTSTQGGPRAPETPHPAPRP